MAGLIARLFGGAPRPPDPDPLPGQGGYHMPPGPAGQSGFPGSTSATRTFRSASPRRVKLAETAPNTPDMSMGTTTETRQVSPRTGNRNLNPRATASVVLYQTLIREQLQHNDPSEFYGGPALKTGPGNQTAGGHPLSGAAAAGGHSERDTITPWTRAQPVIGAGTPGAQNIRNQIAERYKNPPGQPHSYMSAPNPGKPATEVTVPNRFQFAGTGSQTWSVEREMPYGGRGDGARGAQLSGQRYYATGQQDQFFNAGDGSYGMARLQGSGNKQPVGFTEPAPWTSQNYITTASVGTADQPATGAQIPAMVNISPQAGRASNTPGYRRGQ